MAITIASRYWITCGDTILSTDPTSIIAAIPSRNIALANPLRISIFQVPNANRGSLEYRRAVAYARVDRPMATACELMCQPSANSAMELNHQPAAISMTIMATVIHITVRVLRSATSLPASKT